MIKRLQFALLTLRAWVLFVRIDYGFHRHGFGKVFNWVRFSGNPRLLDRTHEPAQIFEAVCRATFLYYRKQKDCLPKAMTTFYLLRRSGIDADLCLGVRQFPFEAHSWVESRGTVLDDKPSRIKSYVLLHRSQALAGSTLGAPV